MSLRQPSRNAAAPQRPVRTDEYQLGVPAAVLAVIHPRFVIGCHVAQRGPVRVNGRLKVATAGERSTSVGEGGAIYSRATDLMIAGCLFENNLAEAGNISTIDP